jgi:hypothetical protein
VNLQRGGGAVWHEGASPATAAVVGLLGSLEVVAFLAPYRAEGGDEEIPTARCGGRRSGGEECEVAAGWGSEGRGEGPEAA